MPTLYRRGRTWYLECNDKAGRRIRRSLKTSDAATARAMRDDLVRAMTSKRLLADLGLESFPADAPQATERRDPATGGGNTPRPTISATDAFCQVTITDAREAYRKWAHANLRPGTLEQVRISWMLFKDFAKPASLEDVTTDALERFKAHIASNKPKIVNNKIADIRAFISRLQKLGMWHGDNPATGIDKLKVPRGVPSS